MSLNSASEDILHDYVLFRNYNIMRYCKMDKIVICLLLLSSQYALASETSARQSSKDSIKKKSGYSSECSMLSLDRDNSTSNSESEERHRRLACLKSLKSFDTDKQNEHYKAGQQSNSDISIIVSNIDRAVTDWDPIAKRWIITCFNAENKQLRVMHCEKYPKTPTNTAEWHAFFKELNKKKPEPQYPSSDSDNSSLSNYAMSDSENENMIAWYAFKDHLKKSSRAAQKNDVSGQKSGKEIPKLPVVEPDWQAFLKKWNSEKEGWHSE